MVYALIFIFGLFFGSFASVIIHRLHKGEKGIFWGRSHCPKCRHTLGFFDLFPLLSYCFGKGKCRYCQAPVSFFYPLVELFMGGLFLLTAFLVGLDSVPHLVFYLFMSFIFVVLTLYDLLFQEVPDEISLPSLIIASVFMLWKGPYFADNLLLGALIPVVFFGALFTISKGRWIGGGDIRVGALMGILMAYPYVLVGLFLGYLSGSIFSLIGLITRKITRKSHIPFVPFLLFGTYVTLFWGEPLLEWYLKLL